MTTINDKIMKDKEASISAIFEADKAAMCESIYDFITHYNIKFSYNTNRRTIQNNKHLFIIL